MRRIVGALFVMVLAVAPVTPVASGGERADWGITVAVGTEDNTLLLQNDAGFRLVVVDTETEIRGAGLRPMTLTDIRPGDHIDYAVTSFAGMWIADLLHVTPRRQAAALP